MKPKKLLFSLILLIVGLVAILNTTTSHADSSPKGGSLFTHANNNTATYVDANELTTVRYQLVTIDTEQVKNAQQLTLNLFEDVVFTATQTKTELGTSDSFIWIGTLDGIENSSVTLVTLKDVAVGTIRTLDSLYEIGYAGKGIHTIAEIDMLAYLNEADVHPPDDWIPTPSETPSGENGINDDGFIVDVMVAYTAAARQAAGGTNAIIATINLAVSETNQGYNNSGINFDMRLVHAVEISYSETGDYLTDINRLTNANDGYMDNVHTLRDSYKADVVSLIVNSMTAACGAGWLMGTPDVSFAPWAFNVIKRSCATGFYTFAHEIGHNMGSHHDRANSGGGGGAYSYSYGYQAPNRAFRTIMAYNCSGDCPRINHWSNPNVYVGGQPTGKPEGDPNSADNVRSLNNTAYVVANFRSTDNIPPSVTINSGPTTWQTQNQATFSWSGSDNQTPTGSLVYSYRIANVTNWSGWESSTSRTITNLPDGWHTFQVNARDEAGNESNIAQRQFGADMLPPSNPTSVNPGCVAANNIWQNSCNDPNFTWSGASDGNGIGLKDYQYYWGTSSTGSPTTYTTSAGFDPTAVSGSVATYYLRVAVRDQLNQQNPNPSTLFILRYDSAAPTASIQINNGSATTNQVNVTINPTASDVGSGTEEVRVSNNGVEWSAWQTYQAGMSIPWVFPALNRQEHTVYAQVKDKAGNLSATTSDTIVLELYPLAPHSANYRLCANVVNAAGQAGLGSTTYRLTSNIGEVWIGAAISTGYQRQAGLLADLENCRPIEYVAGEEFILTDSVIASGGSLRGNANYMLGDTVGETAASPQNAFSSNNYQLTSGFWSDVQVGSGAPPPPPPTPIPVTTTPVPTPGATSTPVPTTFSVSIGNGVQFTNNANVTVRLTAPNVNQVRLSNDGGYADDNWQPYQTSLNWTIDTYGSYALPRFVYAWFKDADGFVYGTYFDDILYDPIAPEGSIRAVYTGYGIAALILQASDDNSGVAGMRVSSDATFSDTNWVAYEEMISWSQPESAVYAQFRDAAGNVSSVYSIESGDDSPNVYLPMIVR
ncbi:MAG: Ig-like domain repeat protein [Chloroflexi bacterium]|nr:Ig-like domain repeat protein [Chloroflexota bacterium]